VLIAVGMGWLIFSNHHADRTDSAEQIPEGAQESEASLALALPQIDGTRPNEASAEPETPVPLENAAALPPSESTQVIDAPVRDASAAPIRTTPEPVQKVAPARANAAAPPLVATREPHSAQWLRNQPRERFTLQLFATTSREKRDQFVSRQAQPERFATFETRRNAEAWYAVTYGNFATRAEAMAAAAALPDSVGPVEPWIRTFASVQATLD
jgi:DamX protein